MVPEEVYGVYGPPQSLAQTSQRFLPSEMQNVAPFLCYTAAWSDIIRLAVNSGVNWGEARGSTATAELLTGLKVGFHFSDDKTQAQSGYIT